MMIKEQNSRTKEEGRIKSASPQRYTYNPHRHTKIWLSKNPDVFMNLENQIRLIKMREKNPNDTIHLVYDSELLTKGAIEELNSYCTENRIEPVDVNSFSEELISENEHKLFAFYKDEITHLDEGGNLAVASDILRWLSPLYTKGSYTDFDFPVDTSNLPPQIEVEAPLLLNIGSLKLGKKEFILSNNDFVAIVDPEAAKEQIDCVHKGFLDRLNVYDTDFVQRTEKKLQDSFFNRNMLKLMRNRSETFYISKSKEIYEQKNTSRALRHYIKEVMSDKNKFLEFNRTTKEESNADIIRKLKDELKKQRNLIKYLFFGKEYAEIKNVLRQDDDTFLHYLMRKERNLYLKSIIVCTTGPIQISNALFNDYVVDIQDFAQYVQPISFNQYNLQKSFRSQNSIPMHESILGMMRFLGENEGEVNDSSWLETGQALQESRIKELEQRQNELKKSLPGALFNVKSSIESHIEALANNSNGIFFKERKKAKRIALEQILTCFNNEPNGGEFNIAEFKALCQSNKIAPRKTKRLVEELDKLCDNAIIFRLAPQRKLKFAKPDQESAAVSL
jgi:glucosyltransferase Lgt1/2/3